MTERPAKKPTPAQAKAAADTAHDEPRVAPEEGNGLGAPEDTGLLSKRGQVIRDALAAAGLPPLPDWPESPEGTDALWAALTAPFSPEEIERKPQPLRRDDNEKGRCEEGAWFCADAHPCGGWHARAVHLDYVGHAGITTRLNDVVGPAGWEFEPYTETDDGWPAMTTTLFPARLTILGVSKWDLAANFASPQEAYGDALRRCAMRFGIGTYLWSKSEAAAAKARVADDQVIPLALPTMDELLKRLDDAAASQAIDREQITAKWREAHGGIPVEELPNLGPENLLPLVDAIESYIAAGQALAPRTDA